MIALVSDHGGFGIKQRLVRQLERVQAEVVDLGPRTARPTDDYPVWASKLARYLQTHPGSRGIAICRSGVGMAMVANKFRGIRAAQVFSAAMAKKSRLDEDSNVLSLAADYQSWPQIQRIVKTWLATPYRPNLRFQRRLKEIQRVERHGR